MSIDVILVGWQETFRSIASRLAADLKVSCQPAGRRHFLIKLPHKVKVYIVNRVSVYACF